VEDALEAAQRIADQDDHYVHIAEMKYKVCPHVGE